MNDAMIGTINNHEFWIDRDLFEYWKYSHFTLDVTDGFGPGGFSLKPHSVKPLKCSTGFSPRKNMKNLNLYNAVNKIFTPSQTGSQTLQRQYRPQNSEQWPEDQPGYR